MWKTLIQRLCFSLLALALTAPRSCCIASGHVQAQAPRDTSAGVAAGSGPDSAPPVVIAPVASQPPSNSPALPPAAAAPAGGTPADSPELARLRALRAEQARAFQELRLVRDERLMLIQEDRAEYPIVAPLIVMGVGFGMSAMSLVVSYLDSIAYPGRMDPDLRATLIAMQVVGIPAGFGGFATVKYRINHRVNRARIRELAQEQKILQRELNEKKRRALDQWLVVPEVSLNDERLGLSIRRAF